MGGSKVQCYETLRIVSLSLGLRVPFHAVLDGDIRKSSFLKRLERGEVEGVVKRDYSMRGELVFTPATVGLMGKVQKVVKEQKETWGTVEGLFEQPCWLVQPFITHLLHVGEVRAFLVEGRLLFKVTTTPHPSEAGCWETTDEPLIRPLDAHR